MAPKNLLKAVVTALFCGWGLWMMHGIMGAGGVSRVHGDFGDARFCNLVLEHNFRFLSGQWPGSFWDLPWMFYPFEKGLALSEVLVGNSLIYAPLRWMGFDSIEAFQGWFIICSLLNFVSFLTLMKVAKVAWWPSLIGAFVFAFSLPRSGFLLHAQLLPQFPTILSLACFLLYTRVPPARSRPLWLCLAAFGFAFQFWTSFYLWWFFFFGILLAVFFALFQPRLIKALFEDIKSHPLSWVAAGAVALVMLLPFAHEYLAMQAIMGRRDYAEVAYYLPRLESYVFPNPDTYFYSQLYQRFSSMNHELRIFPGFGVFAALLAAPLLAFLEWRSKSKSPSLMNWRTATLCFLVASAAIDLSLLRSSGYSLWKYVYEFIPAAGAVRAMGRIIFLILVPASILVAFCLNKLQLWQPNWSPILSGLLGLAIVAEQTGFSSTAYLRADHEARMAKIGALYAKEQTDGKQCRIFYYKDVGTRDFTHIDAMWFSLARNVPTVNGYSGNEPRIWREQGLTEPTAASLSKIQVWLDATRPAEREHVCLLDGDVQVQAAAR